MISLLAFGTYKVGYVPPSSTTAVGPGGGIEECKQVITDALDAGYRTFDCAAFYGNEHMIGEVIEGSGIPRSELFLISKIWNNAIDQGEDAIVEQLNQTLRDLRTEYLDLCLVHWPVPFKFVDAWKCLEKIHATGKIKNIGLSNFTIEDYTELEPHITVKPFLNQIEVSPFLYRRTTISFFESKGIMIQGYRVIRQASELHHSVLCDIAARAHCTTPQVMVRWCLSKNIIVVVKSANKARMLENASSTQVHLSAEDIALLDSLTTQQSLDAFEKTHTKSLIRDTALMNQPFSVHPFTRE
eukprot:c23895_g1_i1.p1 GENE.c23895_g1_i1~~c23895_g1_i1.p1  ORF type:complete len:299 (+),score=72.74 c23895_g1_i1:18-914(+)